MILSPSPTCSSKPLTNFSMLAPELFPLISRHIPKSYRAADLLALALACHRLCEVIIPHLLYCDVRLEGDTWTLAFLMRLRAAAELTTDHDVQMGNLSLSHHIHSLYIIQDSIPIDTECPKTVLHELHLLIRCGALSNLESLTIDLQSDLYDWEGAEHLFWSTARAQCPKLTEVHLTGIVEQERIWLVDSGIFQLQGLESLCINHFNFDESKVPSFPALLTSFTALRHLELRLSTSMVIFPIEGYDKNELHPNRFPYLRVLILDGFSVVQSERVKDFWRCHPGLEILGLGRHLDGVWFEGFTGDMLPNLTVLSGSFHDARMLLPHVAKRLKSLTLLATCNAQAPYLLRTIVPDGILPMLRSLSIHLLSSSHAKDVIREGNRWREDEDGRITEASKRKARRWFDGNYLTSVAKATPRLQELHLSGASSDTLENLTSALSRIPKLETLVLSGPINSYHKPFFVSSGQWPQYIPWDLSYSDPPVLYAPQSFKQAARDLAQACSTLRMICIQGRIGYRDSSDDLACQVIRDDSGNVKDIDMRKNGGMTIGREEDWQAT